jgi:hypothetical protein
MHWWHLDAVDIARLLALFLYIVADFAPGEYSCITAGDDSLHLGAAAVARGWVLHIVADFAPEHLRQ